MARVQGRSMLFLISVLVNLSLHVPVHSHVLGKEKVTQLHFFLHDTIGGKNPSSVVVARANNTGVGNGSPGSFGNVFVIDDPLTEGPEPTSKVVGNAQGLYASTGKEALTLVLAVDFGFTAGKYNGSSISVFSRNPITEEGSREVAVVGGRGRFRLARGFARLRTRYVNFTSGDAIVEYNVTVLHYT